MQDLTAKQLRRAAEIKEKIETLQSELNAILKGAVVNGTTSIPKPAREKKRGPQSAAARERIAAAQRKRWANWAKQKAAKKA